MAKRRCKGKTKAGKRCRNTAVLEHGYCIAHTPKETEGSRRFGGSQPGAGRPRSPRAVDVIRDRIEADVELVLTPLFDALEADRGVVVGSGDDAALETVPDWPSRLAAARELLDRAYGKPQQMVRHGGDDGAPPIRMDVAANPEVSKAAHEFLDRVRQVREK
jgi:hypothetical protein